MTQPDYVPLPLRYRPRTWDDLVGQRHAVAVLKNSIEQDRIFSSYIFAGTAGSGKTSAARIFAMALNCENRTDASPCLECTSCVAAFKLKNPDILEIDGPSHGSVAHARDLKEQALWSPNYSKRVFIIDEVHSLSRDAFEALLKLLEEPPRHAMFILATTNPEKIPATIHSRSIPLQFRRHTELDVIKRLETVAQAESIDLPEESALLIARYSDGNLRDSITVLDQLATTYMDQSLDPEIVSDVLGIVSGTELHTIMESVLNKDPVAMEQAVLATLEKTTEFGMIVRAITDWYRDVMRFKSGADSVIRRSESDMELLTKFTESLTFEKIGSAIRICWDLSEKVRFSSTNPKTFFLTGLYQFMLLNDTDAIAEDLNKPPAQVDEIIEKAEPEQPAVSFTSNNGAITDLEAELAKLTGG